MIPAVEYDALFAGQNLDWLRQKALQNGHHKIADADDILRQIATLKSRLIALDRERSEIVERLRALERAQADETKQQARYCCRHDGLANWREDRAFQEPVSWARGCIAAPVGKSKS